MKITRMRVNHLRESLGFRLSSTVFSWVVEEAEGKTATASRIVVTSDGATVVDTGWGQLDSLAANVDVPLKPRARYDWTVAVRTDAGEESLSPVASFETGKTADDVTLTFDEQLGGHEWDFWDAQIKKIIDWLPLDEADQGFGSGAID